MKLGILVNSDAHSRAIDGITRAAVARGHGVIIFAMDEGTRLLNDRRFTDLHLLDGVTMSFCDHSSKELAINPVALPEAIAAGSQYNNAVMNHQADKVLVL